MRISRLSIENFRGIKRLDWTLPADQRLITLIGPGDSGKSTILESIHLLLGDRWSVSFSDVDFFGVDPVAPIQMKAVLTDVPASLLKDNTFGFWQSGIDHEGRVYQEPEDGLTSCLLVRLTVDESLEPQWEVVRADGEARKSLRASGASSRPSGSMIEPMLSFAGLVCLLSGACRPRTAPNVELWRLPSGLPARRSTGTTAQP